MGCPPVRNTNHRTCCCGKCQTKTLTTSLPCGASCEANREGNLIRVHVWSPEHAFCSGSGSSITLTITNTGIKPLIEYLERIREEL
jgi:hypothetical protein